MEKAMAGKPKTPAQDRLIRLQKSLEKTKNKDASKSKKVNLSNKLVDELKKEYLTANKQSSINKEASILKKNEVKNTKKPELSAKPVREPKKNTLTLHKELSACKEASISKTKPEPKVKQAKIEIKNDSTNSNTKDNSKFRIPKKPLNSANVPGPSAEKKPQKRKPDVELQAKDSNKNLSSPSSSKKLRVANKETKKTTECDINANEENSSKDQKSSLMSSLKGYCTSLFHKVISTNNKNIVEEAKPSLASVKTLSSPKISKLNSTTPTSTKTSPIKFSSKGVANNRLQRLRQSLQEQEKSLNTTPLNSSTYFMPSPSSSSFSSLQNATPNSSFQEDESMDWEPIEDFPSFVTSSSFVSDTSSPNISICSEHADTINENLLRLAAEKNHTTNFWKKDNFYFVVDTNVFLQNITFIDDLISMKLCDTAGTLIYVPYCVLQELDKLKVRSPSESIKTRSARAIKFLNKAFEDKMQRIQAQSSAEENRHLIKVTSPDDSILNCCLQVKEHVDNVLLLTEDINLRNKAKCSDILVSTKSDLISKHETAL